MMCPRCDCTESKRWLKIPEEQNKICYKCYRKRERERHKDKIKASKDAYYQRNKDKVLEKARKWREENVEHNRDYHSGYRAENKEKVSKAKKKSYRKNPEKYKDRVSNNYWANPDERRDVSKAYYEINKEKYILRAFWRKKKIKRATPPWLTDEMKAEIKNLFDIRPEGYHVDHIVPLQGETVCGMNVPWNLQHMAGSENIAKGNKLIA